MNNKSKKSTNHSVLDQEYKPKRGYFKLKYNPKNLPRRLIGNNKRISEYSKVILVSNYNYCKENSLLFDLNNVKNPFNSLYNKKRKNYLIILYILLSNSDREGLTGFISYDMMARVTSLNTRSVIRITQELHMLGYFKIIEEMHMVYLYTSNKYKFPQIFKDTELIVVLREAIIIILGKETIIKLLRFNADLRIAFGKRIILTSVRKIKSYIDSESHKFLREKLSALIREKDLLNIWNMKQIRVELFEFNLWHEKKTDLSKSLFLKLIKSKIKKVNSEKVINNPLF